MAKPQTLIARMQQLLQSYVPVIRGWTTPDGRLPDPYETVYTENYAPANAAVVLASVCRTSSACDSSELLAVMLGRTVELLEDKANVNPFCRVFLYHYGLMALLLAPDALRTSLLDRFGHRFAAYEDDCDVVNTNCAALQWAMELFTDFLGLRPARSELLEHRLRFIANAQLDSGFINDEVTEKQHHDGMPIAYHAFTLFLLASASAVIEHWPENRANVKTEAEQIVSRGMEWLRRAITPDGTFAMIERSSCQMFTWGAVTALIAYTLPEDDDGQLLENALSHWLAYRHEDGTYSCKTNHFPHCMRVGYETYTHLNMYNLLGLTGIAIAERSLDRSIRLPPCKPDRSASEHASDSDCYADPGSGYAFYRRNDSFFGCTMRMHNRRYAPAMQGFHYRAGGQPLPLAEPRLPVTNGSAELKLLDGVWEGYLLYDEDGNPHFPDFTQNILLSPDDRGLSMSGETGLLRCMKTIRISEQGVKWSYLLEMKRPIRSCHHVIPLLVYDGKHALQAASESGNRLSLRFAEREYALECIGASALDLQLTRSLLSVSGAAAQAKASVSGRLPAGSILQWQTSLTMR